MVQNIFGAALSSKINLDIYEWNGLFFFYFRSLFILKAFALISVLPLKLFEFFKAGEIVLTFYETLRLIVTRTI